jgi:RNA-directed DNA polymerase
MLDGGIEKFFDTLDQQRLMRFVEHRVGDKRIHRLIQKWLRTGILKD